VIVVPANKAETVVMAQWACSILNEELELFGFDRYGDPLFQTIGFTVKDQLACVFIANHYMRPSISMSFASENPRWATKGNIAALGKWVFEDLDCDRITTFIKKNNKRSRKFCEGMGFQHEGKLRKASLEGDIIIYGLLKEDHNKWLRKAFNGRQRLNNG